MASGKYYQQTNDARCKQIMLDWFRDRFAAGTPTKNINTVAPFLTLAYLHEENPNPSWVPYLDEWAEWLMDGLPRTEENGFQHIVFNSVNEQQLWDDTLMMSVLPLAKIGRLLNRPQYVEEARRQFMLHIKYLVDRKTGLWFHGWTFAGRHHFANALWARGNCWVTIATPEFIELLDLQPGDALRDFLLETHLQQIRTLVKHQDAGGLWHTLIDDPGSYLEASAAAGFAYGMLKSVRKRYIGEEYLEPAVRAVKAVLANIDASGELKNVSSAHRYSTILMATATSSSPRCRTDKPWPSLRSASSSGSSSDGRAAVRLGNYIAYGATISRRRGDVHHGLWWCLLHDLLRVVGGRSRAHRGGGATSGRVFLAIDRLHLRSLSPYLARQEVRPAPVFHPAGDSAAAELRAHVGRRPDLLVLPDHLLLLRAGVRDGNHPVRNPGRGDVAQLPDQGEVRGRAHHLRSDRQHRGDVVTGQNH